MHLVRVLTVIAYIGFNVVGAWWQDFSRRRRAEDEWWETLRRGVFHGEDEEDG